MRKFRITLFLTAIGAICIALALTSCSKEQSKFTIGVSQCSTDNWRETANLEMMREAAFLEDLDVEIRSVDDNSTKQIEDIEYFIKKGVELLVVSPNEADALTPVIEKAYDSGIPIILYDRKINSEKYTAYVGADNYQIGSQMGQYINSVLPANSKIAIFRGTAGSTADYERYKGLMDVLSSEDSNKYQIVAEPVANFLYVDAKREMTNLIREPEMKRIDAVLALNDEMALGAREVFATSHVRPMPMFIGIDALAGPRGGLEMIANGLLNASFIYPTGGDKVIMVAHQILNGEQYIRENILNTAAVDIGNVRVMLLQHNSIDEQQAKLDAMSDKIDLMSTKASIQKQNVLYLMLSTVLAAMLALVFLTMNHKRWKLNKKLKEQNEQIQLQIAELEEQEKQTLLLSQQLEESTQAKLVFFTNVSHEFKTPLALISGPVNDLVARKDLPADVHNLLDIVRRNTSRLTRLIVELIDFRAYERSRVSLNFSLGDIKSFLEDIASLFNEAMKARKINFIFSATADDFNIPFDPIKIEKVFTNLMSNAFNHVNDGGTIKVSLSILPGGESIRHLHLDVYNSGSYIPEEERENIFRRFYTIDVKRGTGIGLALITSIIDAFGGKIGVTSIKDDGTTFHVDIPIDDSVVTDVHFDNESYVPDFAKLKVATIDSPEKDYDIVEDMAASGKNLILVVEDNKDMRDYLKSILSADYKVIIAKDGVEGTEKALKYRPAVIISDVFMPNKNGFALCKDVKANASTKNIPIILLTAASSDEQRAQGYEFGADAYIQKPFNDYTLKVRIKNLIEKNMGMMEQMTVGFLPAEARVNLSDDSMNFLCQFREYVEQHIDEDISLEDLASHFSYSKSKLYRVLRSITDYSPVDLINLIRLNKAIELMSNEHCNINETAFRCGFTSASYFSRTFQKYYNERPTAYIKRMNNSNK